jgi:hypothetical protein
MIDDVPCPGKKFLGDTGKTGRFSVIRSFGNCDLDLPIAVYIHTTHALYPKG